MTCLLRHFLLQQLNMVFISIDGRLYRPRKESLLSRREKQLPGRVHMAAHTHVTRKDSFDPVTFSNCKRYERAYFSRVFTTQISMTLPNLFLITQIQMFLPAILIIVLHLPSLYYVSLVVFQSG